jgi:prevent-host-death family protein
MKQKPRKTVRIHEAKTHFSRILREVMRGERFLVAKGGKPVAQIVPYSGETLDRRPGGSWAGKIKMARDFDRLPKKIEALFYSDDNDE